MIKIKFLFVFMSFLLVFFLEINYAQDDNIRSSKYNIEGIWNAEPLGGKYYIRQIGNEIFWLGEDDEMNPSWSNVAHGHINENVVIVIWADVLKGSIIQSGNLVIKVVSENEMVLETQTGEFFGTSLWVR